jgi:ABC-type multidrug transport system fused ATPase/permease subunit
LPLFELFCDTPASKLGEMTVGRTVADLYRERSEQFCRERDRQAQRLSWITHGRLATFLAACVSLPASGVSEQLELLVILAGIASIIGFLALVIFHRRTAARTRYYEELRRVNDEAGERLKRNWACLVAPRVVPAPADHGYSDDLDLFGPGSLFQLACTATTPLGEQTLRGWLLEPAEPDVVLERQKAVAELAPLVDLRDRLTVSGRLIGPVNHRVVRRFMSWAIDHRWLLSRRWLVVAAWLLPISTLALATLQLAGLLAYHLWAVTVACALLLTLRTRRTIHEIFEAASSGEATLRRLSELLEIVSGASLHAPRLTGIQQSLMTDGLAAHRQMRRLDRILACSELRLSDLFHLAVQLLTLWDFHVLAALERWREANGRYVSLWFSAFGEAEALSSLAALAHGHPHWVFPEFSVNETYEVAATGLGHPLLRPEDCVVNDVHLGPPGTFLLLTGSNMSGKSTLLRAIGVNVVLAQAGGPVCASRLRLPTARVFTSMHARDSLQEGVSQFMAALNRLKLIVDAARRAQSGPVALLYLLDEILQGTNAAERQTAVRRIIRHLVENGAIGAISTHDLSLADTDDLRAAADPVYFRETIERSATGATLSFDYKLRPGIASSTNALRLMEIVGL